MDTSPSKRTIYLCGMGSSKTKATSTSRKAGVLPGSRSASERPTLGETETPSHPDPFPVRFTSCFVTNGFSLATLLNIPISGLTRSSSSGDTVAQIERFCLVEIGVSSQPSCDGSRLWFSRTFTLDIS